MQQSGQGGKPTIVQMTLIPLHSRENKYPRTRAPLHQAVTKRICKA